jgi:poly(A) polymerase
MPVIPRGLIDPDADKVVRRLRRYGFTAYLVGGCVRDLLLGRAPKDFDVATSATPNEIKSLFRNCRVIGRRFRLAHIFFGPKIIETSTFRANPRQEGGLDEVDDLLIRRDNVFGSAEEDARRRDFTINGLFYDVEEEKVIDYVGGLDDLHARLVRTIGDPEIRFPEDPVRILRAIKFAARLDFDIEPETYAALLRHESEILQCAPPRVLEEVYRLMRGGAARRSMELLLETGVAQTLATELVRMYQGPPSYEGADVEREEFDMHADRRPLGWRVLDELDALIARGTPKVPRSLGARPAPATPPEAAVERTGEIEIDAEHAAEEDVDALADEELAEEHEDEPGEDGTADELETADQAAFDAPLPAPTAADDDASLLTGTPTNALLLGVLTAPFMRDVRSDRPGELLSAIDEVLGPLVERLRISRRDAERARQILIAQKRLAPGRRRRSRPMAMVRRDYFVEALTVYELVARARGELGDEVRRWRRLWRQDQSASGGHGPGGGLGVDEEPGGGPGGHAGPGGHGGPPEGNVFPVMGGRKKRRRRRGGRRRRRPTDLTGGGGLGGGGDEPGEGSGAASAAGAGASGDGGGEGQG